MHAGSTALHAPNSTGLSTPYGPTPESTVRHAKAGVLRPLFFGRSRACSGSPARALHKAMCALPHTPRALRSRPHARHSARAPSRQRRRHYPIQTDAPLDEPRLPVSPVNEHAGRQSRNNDLARALRDRRVSDPSDVRPRPPVRGGAVFARPREKFSQLYLDGLTNRTHPFAPSGQRGRPRHKHISPHWWTVDGSEEEGSRAS